MADNSISEQKKTARAAARKAAAGISESEWRACGEAMAARLTGEDIWKSAQTVFCFISMPNEPDTSSMVEDALNRGKRLCVPRVIGRGIMEAVVLRSLSELEPGAMGVYEPRADVTQTVDFSDIDLAVVPCLRACVNGKRLGRGGGFYDRFLESFGGTSVLLCPERLVVDYLPTEPHDIGCGILLTEKRLVRL